MLGVGIALGAGIGVALGVVFNNIAIGVELGTGVGAALDARNAWAAMTGVRRCANAAARLEAETASIHDENPGADHPGAPSVKHTAVAPAF